MEGEARVEGGVVLRKKKQQKKPLFAGLVGPNISFFKPR
jgi:hypothetical protein